MARHQEALLDAGRKIADHLHTCDAIEAVICFGSVAMNMADEHSDIDLFVFCSPEIPSITERGSLLAQIPNNTAINIGTSSTGFCDEWSSIQDKLRVSNLPCDLTYKTVDWITTVVDHVLTNSNAFLQAQSFRPYTQLGLLENSITLFDRHGRIKKLRDKIYPYPAKLKQDLITAGLATLQESLDELKDYHKRNIGNAAFSFHLSRMSDAICTVLFAANERYDPATKRVEQCLADLPILPTDFSRRYDEILRQPLSAAGREKIICKYISLLDDLAQLCENTKPKHDKSFFKNNALH